MKKKILIVSMLLLALPLAALALPPETPYNDDCPQPWGKPAPDATDFEMSGWFDSAQRYLDCLNDYRSLAHRNAAAFAQAYNELVAEANDQIRRGEMSEDENRYVMERLQAIKTSAKAWEHASDGAQEEQISFARHNGLELVKEN